MKAIFVMLSNYFHDLAVGVLFSSMLLTWLVHKTNIALGGKGNSLVSQVIRQMRRVALAAWMWIIIGGIIRTIHYYDYEWLPAAGRGQVAALIIKHILLAAIAIAGAYLQSRLTKQYLGATARQKEGQPWA